MHCLFKIKKEQNREEGASTALVVSRSTSLDLHVRVPLSIPLNVDRVERYILLMYAVKLD